MLNAAKALVVPTLVPFVFPFSLLVLRIWFGVAVSGVKALISSRFKALTLNPKTYTLNPKPFECF